MNTVSLQYPGAGSASGAAPGQIGICTHPAAGCQTSAGDFRSAHENTRQKTNITDFRCFTEYRGLYGGEIRYSVAETFRCLPFIRPVIITDVHTRFGVSVFRPHKTPIRILRLASGISLS